MSEPLTPEAKKQLPQLPGISEGFYLAGGTALALQINHRVSVDFDFFSEREVPESLLASVEKEFPDKEVRPQVNNSEELTLTVDGVKLTFLQYPFPLLGELVGYEKLKLLNVREIGAAKAYSLGRRATYKDYVDLYFILSEKHVELGELIDMSREKYKHHFEPRLFLEQLIYLDDIKDTEIRFLKQAVDKKQIAQFFEKEVKKANP